MRFSFFSNYLNHHQLPFCMEMVKLLGDNFRFVATTPFNQSRLQNGYADMNKMYDFVVRSYEDQEQYDYAMNLAIHDDVIMIGSAPIIFLIQRHKKNPKGLSFQYSERIYKESAGKINYFNPFFVAEFLKRKVTSPKNLYLLAASAYAPYDFVRSGFNRNRIYKWGYFPEVSLYNLNQLMRLKDDKIRLLWVGRLIDWKHPETAVMIAKMLKESNYSFTLKIIGTGPLREEMDRLIKLYQLEDYVICTGGLPFEQVREEMEKSHIHLFTSDYNEGWGAVLNESMASACAPVCSSAVGAAAFLIENEKSGYLCEYNDVSSMYFAIKRLIEKPALLREVQKNAYDQIVNHWNAATAAKNLMILSESLLREEKNMIIPEGPCSKAEYIKHDEMRIFRVD